jgi:Tol biopolymer transport system component
MGILRFLLLAILYFGMNSLSADAQILVYSGREYLQQGQSWAQIREVDLATNRRTQLTTSARHHWKPWCSPDNKFILFTTGAIDKTLYRFDRVTKRETPVIMLEQDIFAVVGALSDSWVMVQEYGGG